MPDSTSWSIILQSQWHPLKTVMFLWHSQVWSLCLSSLLVCTNTAIDEYRCFCQLLITNVIYVTFATLQYECNCAFCTYHICLHLFTKYLKLKCDNKMYISLIYWWTYFSMLSSFPQTPQMTIHCYGYLTKSGWEFHKSESRSGSINTRTPMHSSLPQPLSSKTQ